MTITNRIIFLREIKLGWVTPTFDTNTSSSMPGFLFFFHVNYKINAMTNEDVVTTNSICQKYLINVCIKSIGT